MPCLWDDPGSCPCSAEPILTGCHRFCTPQHPITSTDVLVNPGCVCGGGLFKRVWGWRGESGPPESRRVSSWKSCPSHVEQPQLLVPLDCGTEGQQHKAPRPAKLSAAPGARTGNSLPVVARRKGHILHRTALQADMELDVERAKELIEQKLAEEEEEEVSP